MKIKKCLGFIMVIVMCIGMLAGCTGRMDRGEKLSDVVNNDLQGIFDGTYKPTTVRYTVADSSSLTGQKTYIITDEAVVEELIGILRKERVQMLDLLLVDPSPETVTFCGTYEDSNGGIYNSYLQICDDYFYDNGFCYDFSDMEALRNCLDKLKTTGDSNYYTEDIDDIASNVTGYWLGEDMDISISQNRDGFYYFRISNSSNEKYSDEMIKVYSLIYSDGEYVLTGMDEMAGDYHCKIKCNSSSLEFEGMKFDKAMME